MNRDEPEEIDQQCNVCGSNIEVGSAWSRCSNRGCITRERGSSIGTDATAMDVHEYYQERDTIERERVDEEVEDLARGFLEADSWDEADRIEQQILSLLQFSSFDGVGDLWTEVR